MSHPQSPTRQVLTRHDLLFARYPNVCLWFDGTGRVFAGGDLLGRFSLHYWTTPIRARA